MRKDKRIEETKKAMDLVNGSDRFKVELCQGQDDIVGTL
jgi:hypothetical protein